MQIVKGVVATAYALNAARHITLLLSQQGTTGRDVINSAQGTVSANLPERATHVSAGSMAKPDNPFRWFNSSPEVTQLVVLLYVRYPLSLPNVEDLAFERGIDICHETVRKWVSRFGPMFASRIRKRRVNAMRQHTYWRWHLDEVYVRVQGEMQYLWRAVDHEGEVLESFVSKTGARRPR